MSLILSPGGARHLQSIDIDGCRRRKMSTVRGPLKFRCDGMSGPPCIVKRGDVVHLNIDFVPGESQSICAY